MQIYLFHLKYYTCNLKGLVISVNENTHPLSTAANATVTARLGSTRDAGEKKQHCWVARVFTKTGWWDCFAQKI